MHIRYEDSEADSAHPFAVGLLLENLSAQSTDKYWVCVLCHLVGVVMGGASSLSLSLSLSLFLFLSLPLSPQEAKFTVGEDMAWKLVDLQNFAVYFDHELLGSQEGQALVVSLGGGREGGRRGREGRGGGGRVGGEEGGRSGMRNKVLQVRVIKFLLTGIHVEEARRDYYSARPHDGQLITGGCSHHRVHHQAHQWSSSPHQKLL